MGLYQITQRIATGGSVVLVLLLSLPLLAGAAPDDGTRAGQDPNPVVGEPLAPDAFQPLVGIPGITSTDGLTFSEYVNALYILSISLAALIAVVKIIFAGVKYMFTDIVTQKGEALQDIRGTLFGLLIVISASLILSTINPALGDLSTFDDPETIADVTGDRLARILNNVDEGYNAFIARCRDRNADTALSSERSGRCRIRL
jgi:hypothetical protein